MLESSSPADDVVTRTQQRFAASLQSAEVLALMQDRNKLVHLDDEEAIGRLFAVVKACPRQSLQYDGDVGFAYERFIKHSKCIEEVEVFFTNPALCLDNSRQLHIFESGQGSVVLRYSKERHRYVVEKHTKPSSGRGARAGRANGAVFTGGVGRGE